MSGEGLGARLFPLALLALPGCGLAFQEPTVKVAEMRQAAVGLQGGTLDVGVQVYNPNRYALTAEDLTYRLSFLDDAGDDPGWLALADGDMAAPVRVEAGETGTVIVEVPFDFASLGAALGRLLRRGELEYRFTGALTVRAPVGRMRVAFDERGIFHR
jgi:LEA14-like dessication related protein